jgi:branched-chain amino acid transport system ATP-binding protein
VPAEAGEALTIRNVSKSFGGVAAVSDASFSVPAGSLTALIGPNGAGKSTMFNLLTNLYVADSGEIAYFGERLAGKSPDRIARLGLIRTFQTARVFAGMSALENVQSGAHIANRASVFEQGFALPRARRTESSVKARAYRMLDVLGLAGDADVTAAALPLGHQKVLEIARALMASPRVLLLDEPAAGLNDAETARLADVLVAINAAGVTMLIVEHNMSLVMSISHDIVVLDAGRVIARGTPAEVQVNERVIDAYIGRNPESLDTKIGTPHA